MSAAEFALLFMSFATVALLLLVAWVAFKILWPDE